MILITGGAGFIGSNLVKAFNDAGRTDLVVCDDLSCADKAANLADLTIADFLDIDELADRLARDALDLPIDRICHQGACTDTMETDGRLMLQRNFTFSKHLLLWALPRRIPMVYASSAATYGAGTCFVEDPANEHPLNVYGYSKLLFDQFVRAHLDRAGSTVVGLRYFNVFGPREQHKGRMASMVYQLYRQVRHTGTACLFEGTDGYADGEQRRDFIYVGDVVRINRHFLDSPRPVRGIFNAGTGTSHSFNQLAQAVIDALGTGRITYRPFPAELAGKYQSFTQADTTALRAAGFDQPFTDFRQAVKHTIDWYEKHHPCGT